VSYFLVHLNVLRNIFVFRLYDLLDFQQFYLVCYVFFLECTFRIIWILFVLKCNMYHTNNIRDSDPTNFFIFLLMLR
jgi:hypothetical protein